MGLQVECPICKYRNSIKKQKCICGKNLSKTSGKVYWIEYYLHGKRKRERIGKSKPAAENRLRLVQTAKVEGRHIKKNLNAEISLNQLRDWYLNLDEVKQLSSFDRIEVLTRHIIRIYGKNISIDEITPEGVRLYREKRRKEFCIPYPEKHPAETTINREVSAFKTMLNKGVRYSILDSNPIRFVPLMKEDNVRRRVLTDEEFERLFNEAEDHLKPILLVAYYHPMRRDEIIKLEWSEVDLSGEVGFIRLSANRTKGKKAGKSVPIHPDVKDVLSKLPSRTRNGRVFLRHGKPFNECKHAFRTALKKSEIHDFRFHDFRRCAVTNLRKAGNDYTLIMKAGGQKTFSMFLRYNLVTEEDLKEMKFHNQVRDENRIMSRSN